MSKLIQITTYDHFQTTLSTSTYVIADFYADWCGPCKAIAPIYDSLATAHSTPGRLAFTKINVDSQQRLAKTYKVSAMPTFLVLRDGKVTQTITGADASALRAAVSAAANAAAKAPAKASAAFSAGGRVLGSGVEGARSGNAGSVMSGLPNVDLKAGGAAAVRTADKMGLGAAARFVGLYFTTLFSMDAAKSAETSPFAVKTENRSR